MALEDFDIPLSSESWEKWWEWSSLEVSEKFKEKAKKTTSGIKRTQKDEKKAKKYDFLLANFLVKFILEKKYDSLFPSLFACVDDGVPSNFIIGILSLIYEEISKEIRLISWKEIYTFIFEKPTERQVFHDFAIDDKIKERINIWIEDAIDSVSLTPSTMSTLKLKHFLGYEKVELFVAHVFHFFLNDNNYDITEIHARKYAKFILWEIKKALSSLSLDEV